MLADAAERQPGVAARVGGGPEDLSGLRDAQTLLRDDFKQWLHHRAAGAGVCVVGNAAGLAGRRLGAVIDSHAAVLRFNCWQGTETSADDLGQRVDVWVVSPATLAVDQPIPEGLSWVIVSAPDPRYIVRQWALAFRLAALGVPVLTVPLPVWRALVRRLRAPPSAGLLVLAWSAAVAGPMGWHVGGGIGWGVAADGRHHMVRRRGQVGARHRWQAESASVVQWRREGLRDLGGGAGP